MTPQPDPQATERPTPETDAVIMARHRMPWIDSFDNLGYPNYLPVDFARRLERERDTAKSAIEHRVLALNDAIKENIDLRATATRQREEIEQLRGALEEISKQN